jgi:hypothetical protein
MRAAAATPGMSFRLVEALAGLGCEGVALDVLRARSGAGAGGGGADSAAALHEAHVGLQIRLSCGLISEAFYEVSPSLLTDTYSCTISLTRERMWGTASLTSFNWTSDCELRCMSCMHSCPQWHWPSIG